MLVDAKMLASSNTERLSNCQVSEASQASFATKAKCAVRVCEQLQPKRTVHSKPEYYE